MRPLIVKKNNKYYKINKYLYNPEDQKIYFTNTGFISKGRKTKMNNKEYFYYFIDYKLYNLKDILIWNNLTDIKIEEEPLVECLIKRKCNKCEQETFDFINIKSKTCIKCLIDNNKLKTTHMLREEYLIVDAFLYKLKAKNWMATVEDLFELINAFDLYFPNVWVATFDELGAGKLLVRLITKHKKIRKELLVK